MRGEQSQPKPGSDDRVEWRKTPVANLALYKSSGIYFARVRIRGKLFRQSMKTDVMSVAKLRWGDYIKDRQDERGDASAIFSRKLTMGDAVRRASAAPACGRAVPIFSDGDFRALEGRTLTISSVLYGLRMFDLDDDVLALVLQQRRLQRAPFEIETADGATLLATQLTVGDGELRFREPALGELRLPAHEFLEEVRRR